MGNMMERTVVLVKPDGLQRGLVGEIMSRFERKGLKLIGLKMVALSDETLDQWYVEHKDKSFFPNLKAYIGWTPVVAMVWEGLEAVAAVRKIVGITKAREAEAGSIRGDFGMSQVYNLIHASDSLEAAERELALVFSSKEIHEYKSASEVLVYPDEDLR